MITPARTSLVLVTVALGLGAAEVRAEDVDATADASPAATDAPLTAPQTDPGPAATDPPQTEPQTDPGPAPTDAPQTARLIDDLRLGLDDAGLGNGAWVSGGVFAGDVRNDAITMGTIDLGLRLAIAADARVSFDWGFAIAATHVRGAYTGPTTIEPFDARHDRVEGRNADLRVEWLPLIVPNVRFGFGLGVAVPVAATTRLPNDAATQSVFDASLLVHDAYFAQNGGHRPWRYRPEHVGLYVPLTLAIALSDDAVLAFDGAGALGLRVLGGTGPDVIADLALGAELGVAVSELVRLGGRVNLDAFGLGGSDAGGQGSAQLWGRLELAPISIVLRGTLGVGGRYGLGSDFVGWGLNAGVGATF